MKLLVFPIDIDASQRLEAELSALGIPVVAASSRVQTLSGSGYQDRVSLPYVTDQTFARNLSELIRQKGITHIYTHHQAVWTRLQSLLKASPSLYPVELVQPDPYERDWIRIAESLDWADQILSDDFTQMLPDSNTPINHPPIDRSAIAGLHQQFLQIPGQCDLTKLDALIHVVPLLPKGDLVEIGSLYGRSAYAMAWLAARCRIGNLICVDPWSATRLEDQGPASELINRNINSIDFEKIFQGFLCHLSLLPNAGYIRETSEDGYRVYQEAVKAGCLETPELGHIPVQGRISLLHIDANHDYRHVRQDIELWEPLLAPGGWVLLDDYIWSFGDGVKQAGDELLARGGFDCAYVQGETLLLRKSS
ncbi:MAG: class I SAM-dependent methyltransferase [Candidatus Thiodiazotropha sp.]